MVHLCIVYLWFRATWFIYVYFTYGLEPHGPSMNTLSMVLEPHDPTMYTLSLFKATWFTYVYFIYGKTAYRIVDVKT